MDNIGRVSENSWNIIGTNETVYMVFSLICGVIMTVAYDFLRARRREKKVAAICIYIEDIIWFSALGVFLYILAFKENSGIVRWYSFFSAAFGAVIYKILFRDRIMEALRKLYVLLKRLICFVVKLIVMPLNFALTLIKSPIRVVAWHTKQGSNYINKRAAVVRAMIKNRVKLKSD